MKQRYIGLRVSADLEQLVERYGPAATAAQALILLGAAALGTDLAPLLPDIAALAIRRQLDPTVRQALVGMINKKINNLLIIPNEDPDPPALLDLGDPLLSVGIEV